MREVSGLQPDDVPAGESGAQRGGQLLARTETGEVLDLSVGQGSPLATRPAAGREADRRPDDRADDLDDRQRLVGNDVIEELVRDIRPVAFTVEKPAEECRVFVVAGGVVPAKPVEGALASLVRTVRATLAHTLKEMAGNRFIEGGTEPITAHARLGGQFPKRNLDLFLLGAPILIAPSQSTTQKIGHDPNGAA